MTRFFAACCLAALGNVAGAQTAAESGNAPDVAVSLVAPESVRAFLTKYLDLPTRLAGDDAQAVLTRRAGGAAGDLLATEGYFTPRIEVRRTADAGLLVEVDPGPRTRVESVVIEFQGELAGAGAERAARRERLRADWPLKAGATFRSAEWTAAKSALLASVAAADHAGARLVDSHAEVDPAHATARLQVVIDAGPAYRFGPLAIEGLKRYDASLVQGLAPFATGDAYRRDALLNFQTILQNTPWFHSVIVEADPAGADAIDAAVPVRVTLAETPSKRVGVGLGYGTNSGARGELNYRNHDFLGRAWDLNSGLRIEELRQTLFADLGLLPDAGGYRLGFGGRLESSDIEGLASTRQVLGVNRSRVKGNVETRLSLDWQREALRPDGAARQTDTALVLDWRWTRRAVDDPLKPRYGNLIDFQLGGAAKHLLSDSNFVRSQLRVQQWWPVGERDTLALRGEAGFTAAASRSGIPQAYLFRSGGGQTVRGHAFQSLGVAEGNAVLGGRTLLVGSLEYTRWLGDTGGPWGAAVFVDVGDAADRWRDLRAAVGVGAGVRWQSPVGPLAFDLARGSRSGRWYPHFAVMVAF